MSHQQQQQQQQQPAAFVNKPARGWLHPDHLIAKVGFLFIPEPNFFHPGSASKNLSILTPKLLLSSRKYDPGFSSQIRIPDPDTDILSIPDPEVKKAFGFGFRIRIRKTDRYMVACGPRLFCEGKFVF
jgi:hypothetical protein